MSLQNTVCVFEGVTRADGNALGTGGTSVDDLTAMQSITFENLGDADLMLYFVSVGVASNGFDFLRLVHFSIQ